jgi:ribosome-associated protein
MSVKTKVKDKLLEAILEGVQRIKGKDITLIDLNTIQHTECG